MRIFFISLLFFSIISTAFGYTEKDKSVMVLRLEPGFQVVGKVEKTDNLMRTRWERKNPQTQLTEKVMVDIYKKPPNEKPSEIIKQYAIGIAEGMRARVPPEKIDISSAIPLPQTNSPLAAWFINISSKAYPLNSITILVDTDPLNLYIITYLSPTYLSTEERNALLTKLKSAIQVCYEPKVDNCYTVQ